MATLCLSRSILGTFQRPTHISGAACTQIRRIVATLEKQVTNNQLAVVGTKFAPSVRRSSSASGDDARPVDTTRREDHDISDETRSRLEALASQSLTRLRLKDMHSYACNGDPIQRLLNAQFLQREIPIRMARRAVDLLTLPHGLSQTEHIQEVARAYVKYIQMFQDQEPPTTITREKEFTDMMLAFVVDRTSIPMTVSQGINSWVDSHRDTVDSRTLRDIESILYRFFTNRVGLRFLVQHHILSDPDRKPEDLGLTSSATLGCIQADCDPVKELGPVVDKVTRLTRDCFGVCPRIMLIDSRTTHDGFTHVPHLLQYIVTELLKNSCRATVNRYARSDERDMPPIKVVVVQGKEDVTIKVSDEGGGAPRSIFENIWNFTHSTSPDSEADSDFGKDSAWGVKIRGFGLPLARIYARYFGGELELLSLEEQGVDAYLYLPRLGSSYENLQDERTNMWKAKRWSSSP